MDIAFIVVKNISRGGGIEKYTLELGSRLVKRGHDVTVYSMDHYGEKMSECAGMKIQYVSSIKGRVLEKGASAFFAFLKAVRHGHDIFHFHTIPAGTWIGLARLLNKKCVLQWHGLEWKRSRFGSLSSKIALMLERYVIKQKVYFTAVSKVQCKYFLDTYGIDVKYIPTGADIKIKPEPHEIFSLGLEPDKYLLFASRLVREKGAHYLIPAFKAIDTDYKLVIAGDVPNEDGYKKGLHDLADGDERIVFPGFVEGRLLEELFSHCYLYVQPSDIEGLSIALLEAMSYGCRCLVSDIPENQEALGDVGRTFEKGDIESLSTEIRNMLDSKNSMQVVSENARKRVQGNYSWDLVADEFELLYSSMLEKK